MLIYIKSRGKWKFKVLMCPSTVFLIEDALVTKAAISGDCMRIPELFQPGL